MKQIFTIIPQFLNNPQAFFASVQRNENLRSKAVSLFISTVVFFMVYGFVTGLSHSWLQAVSTAVKMPLLFLLTLAFTLPALYFFTLALLNIQFSVAQAGVVVLSGIGVTAFLLLGLSPVTLFFVLTSSNYPFFQLLAVVFVAISGFTGLIYVLRGFSSVVQASELTNTALGSSLLRAWVVLYAFVGAQMTWRLSPLVGDAQQPFYLLQPSRDNFFIDVIHAFQASFGMGPFSAPFDLGGALFFGAIMLIVALAFGIGLGARQSASKPAAPENILQSETAARPTKL